MEINLDKIAQNEQNIRTALEDYGRYTDSDVLEDVSDKFIKRLAEDNFYAKQELRALFRKSPAWNEALDAIVINGNRTHDPDFNRIENLAYTILDDVPYGDNDDDISDAIRYFSNPDPTDDDIKSYIEAINRIAPNAYKDGKKKSRIFRDICVALGIADNTAGSKFQRLYAQFADELSTKQIDFKLYVSVNPAHFITMSNPKRDSRGSTLTSCHSFNSIDYEYNVGCTGYARDEFSFIVFTAADPSNPETLNNRKTTRQIFWYKPGDGVLLQSRLYNTSGGVNGAQYESKVYRDLIQREIADLEGDPNLWNTTKYCSQRLVEFREGSGYGGYPDWTFSNFNAKISIKSGLNVKDRTYFIGTYGLCIVCGEETDEGVYCNDCYRDSHMSCDWCGDSYHADDLYTAYDRGGSEIQVCASCLEDSFRLCNVCGEYHHISTMTHTESGEWVCEDCLDEYFVRCNNCGAWVREEDATLVTDEDGDSLWFCNDCDYRYAECQCCGEYYTNEALFLGICPSCIEDGNREVGA